MEEKQTSIIKSKSVPKSMDYQFLRKEAINNTQSISGDNWTDYNIHDPGVTILEQFSYALTDISYRTNLSIETLLFHGGNSDQVKRSNGLFPPEDILPTTPLTVVDYRILILDALPNKISNCWVDPIKDHREGIQGLYDVTLLLRNDIRKEDHESIKKEVQKVFVGHRNLGEDLNQIKILKADNIALKADIDIYQDEDAEDILAELLFEIEEYFNPTVRFYSKAELEKKGKVLDEIFDIPSFKHGFITPEQLKPKTKEYFVSKIADHILNVKGVRGLRNLQVSQDGVPVNSDSISVEDDKFLTLGLLRNTDEDDIFKGFDITLQKGGAINNYLKSAVIYELEIKEAKSNRNYELTTKSAISKKSNVRTSELLSFESIQMNFPGIFGVGDYTPAKEEGAKRLAQSNQLKAYLMFFDQIMSNHLVQISKLSDIFSIEDHKAEDFKTYYSKALSSSIPDASTLLKHTLESKSDLIVKKEVLEAEGNRNLKENYYLDNLYKDLELKDRVVNERVEEIYNALIRLPKSGILKSTILSNREILQDFVGIKDLLEKDQKSDSKDKKKKKAKEVEKAISELKKLISAEIEEQTQDVDLEQRHLDLLMSNFDAPYERKNRLLSHLLARFGEKFTTDFHIKFSSLMEGESQESIDKKLIELKSLFLKEIVNINKVRSRGLDYLSKNAIQAKIPLKQKISLLLDFNNDNQPGSSSVLNDSVKVKKLSGAEVEKNTDSTNPHIVKKEKGDKVTFLINSSSYFNYLFKYGLKEECYKLENEQGRFITYFAPPTDEIPTLLFDSNSKEEANKKRHSLIKYLRKLNADSENFHIVEHILLRPLDSSDCHFIIKGDKDEVIYKSREVNPEDTQKKVALDALLLGCYQTNYKILQNPEKEYVVTIKNSVGYELAKSSQSYLTKQGAQKFIDESISYFKNKKETDDLNSIVHLDNQKKYLFDLLSNKDELLFQSINALSINEQEKIVADLEIYAINPSCYTVSKNTEETYLVEINNYEKEEVVRSHQKFQSPKNAEDFIQYCINYFENLRESNGYRSKVRYRRLNGRNADDFNAQISVVYSSWTSRFDNQEFLQLFKQTLFYCSPAHLSINLVGLNYQEMKYFEEKYSEYIKELHDVNLDNHERLGDLSNTLLEILSDTV